MICNWEIKKLRMDPVFLSQGWPVAKSIIEYEASMHARGCIARAVRHLQRTHTNCLYRPNARIQYDYADSAVDSLPDIRPTFIREEIVLICAWTIEVVQLAMIGLPGDMITATGYLGYDDLALQEQAFFASSDDANNLQGTA